MVDIKSVARKVIQDETVAIQNLINYIDDDFEAVVRLIYENKGRVIITGIGKSANRGNDEFHRNSGRVHARCGCDSW